MRITSKLFSFLFLFMLLCPCAYGQTKEVCLFPFAVHAERDSGQLQSSLHQRLLAQLEKEKKIRTAPPDKKLQQAVSLGTGDAARAGSQLGIDYIITGSVTKFGDTLNVDMRIIDTAAQATLPVISVQGGESTGQEELARQLAAAIMGGLGLADKIIRIDIAGNRKIGADAIRQKLISRPGEMLNEEDVSADIKAIFKMGFFADVQAEVTADAQGKILTYTVTEKGLISEIRILGNKKLDKDDITGVMSVKTRQSVNQDKIKEDIQKIKGLYETKGYYNAEITHRLEQDGPKDFVVVLNIKENERVYIRSITFEGNEAFTNKELVNMMSTSERTLLGFITDTGILQPAQLKQDIQKLTSFYFNNGFVNAQIGEPVIERDTKGIHIKIAVREGRRFKFGKVGITGDTLDKPLSELMADLKTKTGNYYSRETILKDMEAITTAANDEGYAQADVTPNISSHEKEQTLDVNFHLEKGNPIYIARISISGNTITRDKVIRRRLALAEGDLYSSSKLKAGYEGLNYLNYFEEVDIQTEKGQGDTMDLNIRVKEKNTGMFMIGAGYSAVDQAVIMAQISQQNFLGYGQELSLKASLGSKTNNYELSFTEPWLFDMPLWSKADLWKYDKEYDNYKLDTAGGGLMMGHHLFERVSGYVGYRLSVDKINVTNEYRVSEYIRQEQGQRVTSSVTVTLSRDTTNDMMFPSKGSKASVSVQHAGIPFGGNTEFTRYGGSAAWYYALYGEVVFGVKGRIGYLQSNHGKSLPIYERYVLGGINSLRGLRYIGPEDELVLRRKYSNTGVPEGYEVIKNPVGTSDVMGGTSMLSGSLEVVFPLIREAGIKGVVFYDTGNTWNGHYRPDDLRHTVGTGVRWQSPIGPLRLEYGYVLDRRDNEKAGRWEFTIGMFM